MPSIPLKNCRTVIALVLLSSACSPSARGEEGKTAPCRQDAMIVFDDSGSMSGNQTLGIPNSQARIDVVRSALAEVLPSATRLRKMGLITFGPGPWNQCNVHLNLKPTANAAFTIMSEVNALVPAGKTPLTSGVEQAANVLDYRNKPGAIVVVTDGEETCGRSPCDLAKKLHAAANQLTIHVIVSATRVTVGRASRASKRQSASPNRAEVSISQLILSKTLRPPLRRPWIAQ
jgi:Ca-activated chloride channel homolog